MHAGHGSRVGFDVLFRCFYKIDIRKTENRPHGKEDENVFSALISLTVCAEMWLIIRTVNAETHYVSVSDKSITWTKRGFKEEVNIFFMSFMHFI